MSRAKSRQGSPTRDGQAAFNNAETLQNSSLALPDIRFNEWKASEALAKHFGNFLDARLYDDAHRILLQELAEFDLAELAPSAAKVAAYRIKLENDGIANPAMSQNWMERFSRGEFDSTRRVRESLKFTSKGLIEQMNAASLYFERLGSILKPFGIMTLQLEKRSTPSVKWLTEARALWSTASSEDRYAMLEAMIRATNPTPRAKLAGGHFLRGLIYLSADWDSSLVAPMLTEFALKKCYQTEPGFGIKGEKFGNSCLWALSNMPDGAGVPYLARILARTKYPKIRSKIDIALNEAAAKAGVSRATLDELTVPTHNLDAAGTIRFAVGGGEAVAAIVGNRKVVVNWFSAEAKPLKAPDSRMKEDREAIKEVKAATREIEADLAAQIARLQRLYIENRDWPYSDWQTRYLDHPLIGALVSRLIWFVEKNGNRVSAHIYNGKLVDVGGNMVESQNARIRLWHPIDDAPNAVVAWRDRLERLRIVQPFAQAWREIYRITDAERTTGTYSNRWAGHILKQHQAMTLARLNGWTVTHRMWVDAPNDAPWHIMLPAHGLVADYWVEGAGDRDNPAVLESQAYVYVATDRLVFHRIAAHHAVKDSAYGPDRSEPVAVDDIPPVVLSEVMRQCDLFTAIASIASDPNWLDRGSDAAHPSQWDRDAAHYWAQAGFAQLTASAKIRREMLERIVPQLAIADRCVIDEQALLVQGIRHRYRIHLGSAAVHIAATNQHVCIVPSFKKTGAEDIWLPFEGDTTLSVILSKASLLAADDKITDPVILLQI